LPQHSNNSSAGGSPRSERVRQPGTDCDKDRLDVIALRQLLENPKAFD
jgi:hypothetical protein